MPRYKLLIEYDGTPFKGWQRQDNGISVQEVIERACGRLAGTEATVYAAGRTDAGVHACGQVAHVDLPRDFTAETVRDALNFHIKPHPVAVLAVEKVTDDFHARFSATGRAYIYRIFNRRVRPALDRQRSWWVVPDLDVGLMAEGAAHLIGHHDFSSFRDTDCQANSPWKTLDLLRIVRDGESIAVHAAARSFLHHQVRNMVGTLKLVGEGKWAPDRVRQALEARDRRAAGPTAPAGGLYLTGVTY
jgi:tRNA pseudouridine38-40 synthase